MPRFTCESCGTGLYSAARTAALIDPTCPTCGALPGRRELERPPDPDASVRPLPAAAPAVKRLELQR